MPYQISFLGKTVAAMLTLVTFWLLFGMSSNVFSQIARFREASGNDYTDMVYLCCEFSSQGLVEDVPLASRDPYGLCSGVPQKVPMFRDFSENRYPFLAIFFKILKIRPIV